MTVCSANSMFSSLRGLCSFMSGRLRRARPSQRDLDDSVDDPDLERHQVLVEAVGSGRLHALAGAHVVAARVLRTADDAGVDRTPAELGSLVGTQALERAMLTCDVRD